MMLYIVIILLFSVYLYITIRDLRMLFQVTKLNRGTRTERKLILFLLKYGIDPHTIFHNLYLVNYKDNYSQIDVVAVTNAGIIVFEVKDYSGWIFGNGYNNYWTQTLAFGNRRYRFYNPIKQNNKHIEVLKKQLQQFNDIPFYSVIIFYGDCSFRALSNIPDDTIIIKPNRLKYVLRSIS